nr:septum formation family protein [Nonomuraea basaltis]
MKGTGPAAGTTSSLAGRVFALAALPNGSCLATDQIPRGDGTVQTVDCKGPHKIRTYAATDLPRQMRGGAFPGHKPVYDFALSFCDKEFLKIYKGTAGKDGRPIEFLIAPLEKEQWRPEEKRVICATITDPNA